MCYDYSDFEMIKNYAVFLDKYLPNCSQQKTFQRFCINQLYYKKTVGYNSLQNIV